MRRLVLVTGATRGIGRETALSLNRDGHDVVLGCRDIADARALVAEMSYPERAAALALDVRLAASVAEAAQAIETQFGRLDGLINNAGVFAGGPVGAVSFDDLSWMMEVNFIGPVLLIDALLPLLARSPRACVVNVSSTTGSIAMTADGALIPGDPAKRLGYCCTKAALNMATVQFARSFAGTPAHAHVRINSVSPGYTATAMNDFRGERTVADAAREIVRLATLDNDGPTGMFFYEGRRLPW